MQSYLAVYDPAHTSPSGDFWAWRHDVLPPRLLQSFYYDYAERVLPDAPNELRAQDIRGGCVLFPDQWACWYRFINGGRDNFGRPGRCIILCAFVSRTALVKANGIGILESAVFRSLCEQVPPCPLPPPAQLTLEWSSGPLDGTLSSSVLDGLRTRKELHRAGPGVLVESGTVVAAWAGERSPLHVSIRRDADGESADYIVVDATRRPAAPRTIAPGKVTRRDAPGPVSKTGGAGLPFRPHPPAVARQEPPRAISLGLPTIICICVGCLLVGCLLGWLLCAWLLPSPLKRLPNGSPPGNMSSPGSGRSIDDGDTDGGRETRKGGRRSSLWSGPEDDVRTKTNRHQRRPSSSD